MHFASFLKKKNDSAFKRQEEIGQTIQLMDVETKTLFSLSTAPQYDATFIRYLLGYLYKDDKSILTYRSFSGRTLKKKKAANVDLDAAGSSQSTQFKPISPEKKSTIFSLFRKRIENSDISKCDKFKRLRSANISHLVGIGISNIRMVNKRLNDIQRIESSSHSESVSNSTESSTQATNA